MKTFAIFILGLLMGGGAVAAYHYNHEKALKVQLTQELLYTDFKTLQQLDKKNYSGLRLALIQGMNATIQQYKGSGLRDKRIANLAVEINRHLEEQKLKRE